VIDFRYHLVSIVSIFLALAVGIVLGAGPLQQGISRTVSQELSQLRQDKSDLRAQLDEQTKASAARDAFAAAANPTLVADALVGRTVSLVVLPGADAGTAKATATVLELSGARVASTTTVHDTWVSSDKATADARDQLAERLATNLGADPAAADGSALDAVLARLLVRKPTGSGTGVEATPPPIQVTTAVEDLTKADLLEVDVPEPVPAELSVVIGADNAPGSSDADTAAVKGYVTLAKALDLGSSGAVLASDVGVSGDQKSPSVVIAARDDGDAVKAVSTIDDVGLPMGRASIVFALTEQLDGGAGQYGLESGVTAAFPPLPASTP
jgi:hypothetical protein